ncbi:MAG: glycosyltransferase family A protein [Flavobacterium sp.]|uniref:glycosyltransferase family 2 protein n=1 Tax=Flavobacterium sp. TaxID=239 RepID=UPI0022BD6A29|nr:glycosyltransferase family A protein [Flavobacterium sp.]MCZ8198624.1 glycosyltransferase family A protein [Flavobacterium sp.]
MDILIKSYNRPYYLDRCIQSIYLNCINSDFKIKILDDGTPHKYLDKLQNKFPDIQIYKSEFYEQKVNFTSKGKQPEINKIPIELWLEGAKNASDYFILLEDDIWFVEKFDLNMLHQNCIENKLVFVKMFWLGNEKLIQSKTHFIKDNLTFFEPNLYLRNPLLYKFVFYKFNRFKIRKTLKALRIHTYDRFLSYYSIYAVAGVVFRKDYFLSLWNDHKNEVDEGLQLYNSVKFLKKNRNKIGFAHTTNEVVKTGFLSSATNQFKNYKDVKIDMFLFNKTVNEAWYNDQLDVMQKYPKDLNSEQIAVIIEKENNVDLQVIEWKKWVSSFKNQFQSFGCNID